MTDVKISAVTALYDIGRELVDGRSISQYVGWFNETLKLPIDFTVFLDPSIDINSIHPKPGDTIIQSPLSNSEFFEFLPHVEQVAPTKKRFLRPPKLVYRLPKYAIVQFSKFSFLRRTAEMHAEMDGLFWIDAGGSRHMRNRQGLNAVNTEAFAEHLKGGQLSMSIVPLFEADMATGKARRNYVGTSERLVTGTTFLVRRAEAAELAANVHDFLKTVWVPNMLWDNEEVGLGEMVFAKRLKINPVIVSKRFDDYLDLAFTRETQPA